MSNAYTHTWLYLNRKGIFTTQPLTLLKYNILVDIYKQRHIFVKLQVLMVPYITRILHFSSGALIRNILKSKAEE